QREPDVGEVVVARHLGDTAIAVRRRDAADEGEDPYLFRQFQRARLVVPAVAAIVPDVQLEQAMAYAPGGVDHLEVGVDGLDVGVELSGEGTGLRGDESELDVGR